jgi:voltage-gated potassium channel
MISVVDVPWLFRNVIRRLGQTSTIAVVIFALILSVVLGAGLVAILEAVAGSNGPTGYLAALWWFVVAITGVGLDAVAPVTQLGRATSAGVLMLSRIFFGMFTAAIASALINRLLMEGRGMGDVSLRGHSVICGWNGKGNEMIRQLTGDERKQEVVVLCDLESTPVKHTGVHFVHGDPTTDADLRRACVQWAETVIILADESYPGHSPSTVDARSVLVALAVETLNRNVYTFAEVCDPDNKHHFLHANVDEVLVADEIVADLMARSSVLHGLTRVVSDLLTIGTGSDIYVVPAPQSLVGIAFDDALLPLQKKKRAILVGIERAGEIMMNPADPLIIANNDRLIMISRRAVELE